MREKCIFFTFLFCSLIANAQFQKSVLKIERGETLILDRSPRHLDSLIIKGQLIIKDRRNIKISVRTIIIDGGLLQIGTPEDPFRNKITINFNILGDLQTENDCKLLVKNNGRISMHGLSGEKTTWTQLKNTLSNGNNILQLKDITNWQRNDKVLITSINNGFKNEIAELYSAFNREAVIKTIFQESHTPKTFNFKEPFTIAPYAALLSHTIEIGLHPDLPKNTINTQLIIEDSAGEIAFSGVAFSNLGTTKQHTSILNWTNSKGNSFIKNCSFYDLNTDAIVLDKTSISISNSVFFSNAGTVITCAVSGSGQNNKILDNLIVYDSYSNDSEEAGIKLMNPFQLINGNQIIGPRFTSGILYHLPKDLEAKNWNGASDDFSLQDNFIYNLPSIKSSSKGIYLENFQHKNYWKILNNTVVNYSRGIQIDADNNRISKFKSYNNPIGVISASNNLNEIEIFNPDKRLSIQSKAISIISSRKLTPKVTDVTISGYDIGVEIGGRLDKLNSFEKINFKNVKSTLNIEKLNQQSYIRDIDGSFGTKNSSNSKEVILVPKASFLRYDKCIPIDEFNEIYSCDFNQYGTLLLSTGTALDRPLEKHENAFKNTQVRRGNLNLSSSEINNKKIFLTPVNEQYELFFESNKNPIYDICLEWKSKQDSWIITSFPYAYEKVFGLRSFGGLIKPVESLEQLRSSKQISYIIDKENKKIYVKLFNRQHNNKIIFYAVKYSDNEVPFRFAQSKKKRELTLAYEIPKNTETSVRIKDINGNIIKTLFDGKQRRKFVEIVIDVDQYNLENELRFYELTINDKVYRGPIYVE